MISFGPLEEGGGRKLDIDSAKFGEPPLTPEVAEALRAALPHLSLEEVIEELRWEAIMYFESRGDLDVDSHIDRAMLRTMAALLHAIAALQASSNHVC